MLRQVLALLAIGLVVSSDALAQQALSQQAQAHQAVARKGAGLKLALLRPLDSATAKAGDDVPLRLSRPLVVNGVTLLREGDVLHGKVTRVKRSGPRCFTTPAPDAMVDDQIDTGHVSPFVWLFVVPIAGPFVVAFIAITSPVLLLNTILPGGLNGCTIPGKEFQMPANATVGVVIMRDHHVSY